MPISVVMPALEMAQETGKLVSWRKKEGESVSKGETLLEIETDKAIMEIESPGDGVLSGVKAHEGAEIPVGQTIAWILRPGEAVPTDQPVVPSGRHQESVSATAGPSVVEAVTTPSAPAAKISPKARRLAKELGVDLTLVRGSGAVGEILAADVEAAAKQAGSAGAKPPHQTATALSSVARLMAERTAHSWATVPHFFVVRDVNAAALNEARAQITKISEQTGGARVTLTDLLVGVVARVLARHPRLNASWSGETIRTNADINVGLAMAIDDGVVAPVIANADRLSVAQTAVQRAELSERARAGKLRPADLAGGTFTISNLGMYQVDAFSAIIIEPQAAILAIGGIADRVVALEGKPVVRPMLTLTLSSDHRVVDGARAAQFMEDLVQALQIPSKWIELR
jgi:pyruvate dehydrogenase E2 component (dihydrolipoyllysine-residue acetyltransferase)